MSNIINLNDSVPANTNGGSFKVANISGGQSRHELSGQWCSRPHDQRFLSLDEIRDHRQAQWDNSRELIALPGEFEAVAPEIETKADLNRLSFKTRDGDEVQASHWAFGQLAQRAHAPAAYLRRMPSPIVAEALNYGLKFHAEKDGIKAFLQQEAGSDAIELTAATGVDYGRINDGDVIRAVQNIAGNGLGETQWKIPGVMDWRTMIYDPNVAPTKSTTTLFASDRDMFLFLVDDKNPIQVGTVMRNGVSEPDIMFRGFYVRHSMVGSAPLDLCTFYLRALCCNRIMWGVEGFEQLSIRHSKLAPDRFIHQAVPALNSFHDGSSQKLIEGVEKAKAAKVAKDDDDMIDYLRGRKFSMDQARKIMTAVETEEGTKARTVWDIAQGVTAIARNIPNNSDRVELEGMARKLLDKVAA